MNDDGKPKVRLLALEDIPKMQEILKSEELSFHPTALARFIETDGAYGFVALVKSKVVGLAYGYRLTRMDGGAPMFYLHSIGLLEAYRGKGIGSQLLEYIVSFAKDMGCSECFAVTNKGNVPACRLYEKAGGNSAVQNEIVYVMEFGL